MAEVKNSTKKQDFYLSIVNELKVSTNLTKIKSKLTLSKQELNYYLRQLKKEGFIIQRGRGWYEVVKEVKNSTKYDKLLVKDSVRGHAYIWTAKLPKEIEGWNKRIEILKEKGINFKLVGAKENTPRIKVLGRKVWLCNDHLRIYDKKEESYYGLNAKESRFLAFQEIKHIVGALNNKLGIFIKPSDIYFKREHYALIKNDLAIEENKRGNIWHISDEDGEWLLVDDSLGKGGELENIGKGSFKTNIPLQNWWNDNKKNNFEVTSTFILNTMNGIQQNQLVFDRNMSSHLEVLGKIGNEVSNLGSAIKVLNKKIDEMNTHTNERRLEK